MSMDGPLSGLKVLDFTHVLAGPFATRILGDMGADVVKINSQTRAIGTQDATHPYYLMWNRNKRALAIDLTTDEGKEIAFELCLKADIVIDNFSVGVLDRWGIGYEKVRKINTDIIYVQMSGMGEGGPWSDFVTYAPTIHALSGLTISTGVPGREDIGLGFSYNDHQAGLHGAFAVLAALEGRRQHGKSQRIDISQFEIGCGFLGPALMDLSANGNTAGPSANDLPFDQACPHECYRCLSSTADANQSVSGEEWIAIACMNDKQWEKLTDLIGIADWAAAMKLDSVQARLKHKDEINEKIETWTSQGEAYTLMELCQNAGIPAGVVQNGVDLIENDPQLKSSHFFSKLPDTHPDLGEQYLDRLPINFEKYELDDYRRVRVIGEDNEEVMKDWLDRGAEEVKTLEDNEILK